MMMMFTKISATIFSDYAEKHIFEYTELYWYLELIKSEQKLVCRLCIGYVQQQKIRAILLFI